MTQKTFGRGRENGFIRIEKKKSSVDISKEYLIHMKIRERHVSNLKEYVEEWIKNER